MTDRTNSIESDGHVEVSWAGSGEILTVGVRNSRIPGEVVWFTREEWEAFVAGAKDGEFDLP
jgi:Domain of unknown function (DUF397)